ncbi:MAG: hypothetical protein Q9164_002427 [Protoblastenia rupestris]
MKTTSSASSRTIWPGKGHKDDRDQADGFTRLDDSGGGRWGHNADVRAGKPKKGEGMDDVSLEELNPASGEIRVKNEVVVTTEKWDYKDKLY